MSHIGILLGNEYVEELLICELSPPDQLMCSASSWQSNQVKRELPL